MHSKRVNRAEPAQASPPDAPTASAILASSTAERLPLIGRSSAPKHADVDAESQRSGQAEKGVTRKHLPVLPLERPVRRYGTAMFHNRSEIGLDPDGEALESSPELDLGRVQEVGTVSFHSSVSVPGALIS